MPGDYDDGLRGSVKGLDSSEQVTRFGPGALHEVGDAASHAAMHKALLVVDPAFVGSQAMEVVVGSLRHQGIDVVVHEQVTATPTVADAEAAGRAAGAAGCDGVVSLGGGSAIDVGKGAAILSAGGSIHDYGHGEEPAVVLPHIACPTTAGTGAEQSHYAFFIDTGGHEHTVVDHAGLVPVAAVIDPITHLGMSPRLTAATGLNALSDAIEAYLGPAPTPTSDKAALAAIEGIADALPRVHADGRDLAARTDMARAAYRAGEAFNEAGLGMVDSISLVLSGLFSIGHSEANGIVLPHVMRFQSRWAGERLPAVAKALGGDDAVDAVEALRRRVGLRETLSDHGVGWDDVYLAAHAIIRHPFNERDPHGLGRDELAAVLVEAMGLDLPRSS